MKLYLDSSALVKLVRREAETEALQRYMRRNREHERVSSALARVEVVRTAFLGGGFQAVARARHQLARMYLVAMDTDLLERAALIGPGTPLRSLDAIHLATAQGLGADLRAVVTYDVRMTAVAGSLGIPVEAPI